MLISTKFCFFNLCVTADICSNKPVTKEFPYWLSQKSYLRKMAFETYRYIVKPRLEYLFWSAYNNNYSNKSVRNGKLQKPNTLPKAKNMFLSSTSFIVRLQWATVAFIMGVKWPGREADHSLLTDTEFKKAWICNSTPLYAFIFNA
jgi:hypothetical protein